MNKQTIAQIMYDRWPDYGPWSEDEEDSWDPPESEYTTRKEMEAEES